MRKILPLALSGVCLAAAALPCRAEKWETVPLGQPAEDVADGMTLPFRRAESRRVTRSAEGSPIGVVANGAAACVLVVPDKATGGEKKAAELLRETFRKMSGVDLPVLPESKVARMEDRVAGDGKEWPFAIWIGATRRAEERGVTVEGLRPEGFRIYTAGNECFIRGNDASPYDPPRPVNGTLFAATSLLENHFGVRWLWPGDLGEIIPRRNQVELPPMDEQDEPALNQRIIRNISAGDAAMESKANIFRVLQTDAAAYRKVLAQNDDWLARQKMGYSEYQNCGHSFVGWYEEYGEAHPEWFALQPDGTRKQFSHRERLCVSNPELAREVARRALVAYEGRESIPGGFSVSPNDGGGKNFFCMCSACRKLDPSNGQIYSMLFAHGTERLTTDRFYADYPSLSDRYAIFYNRIAEEVAKKRPDAQLVALAYHVYSDAPLKAGRFHPALTIGYVGGNFLSAKATADARKQWDGWAKRASRLFYRPNLLHPGMGLPFNYANALGDDVRHFYETGMIATDYDSLLGHWATQGLNYYVLARMLWNPAQNPAEIIDDYCRSGFGSAAEDVKEYFASLERMTKEFAKTYDQWETRKSELQREEWADEGEPPSPNLNPFSRAFCEIYTPEKISGLRAILHRAGERAAKEPQVRERIAFLEKGLDHAEQRLPLEKLMAEGREKGTEAHSLPMRKALADWYAQTLRENPLAVSSVECARRSYFYFQGINP